MDPRFEHFDQGGGVSAEPLTSAQWRAAMGCFPSGVTVVTSWDGERPIGSTVSSFCSVSLEPPLLLVCLDLNNPIQRPLEARGVFGVNILDEEAGHGLARHFAIDPGDNRFTDLAWDHEPGGAPRLADAPLFVDCVVESAHAAGDHRIIVGRGLRISHASTATPLLYHKGAFPKLRHGA